MCVCVCVCVCDVGGGGWRVGRYVWVYRQTAQGHTDTHTHKAQSQTQTQTHRGHKQTRTRGEPDDEACGNEPVDVGRRAEKEAAEEEDAGVDEQRPAPALLVGQDPAFWVGRVFFVCVSLFGVLVCRAYWVGLW